MKNVLFGLLGSLLLIAPAAFADPLKEIAEVAAPRAKAYSAGDVDGWTGAFADNAVFFGSFSPFRVEGKPAIRAAFSEHFGQYTNRRYYLRQSQLRPFGDSLAVADGYYEIVLTDRSGKTTQHYGRYTAVWAKLNGRWQIVQQQNSALPDGR